MTEIVEKLMEIQRRMNETDPLLQRGIERDWVCVVHPAVVNHLRQLANPEESRTSYFLGLSHITGRTTYIVNEAPDRSIEYMSREVLAQRYPEFIEREFAARKWLEEHHEDDDA